MGKLISIPDPGLISDPYVRQILNAMRSNMTVIASQISGISSSSSENSAATSGGNAAKLVIKPLGTVAITATVVDPTTVTLAALATEHNQLLQDVTNLSKVVKTMQAKQNEIIKSINKLQ